MTTTDETRQKWIGILLRRHGGEPRDRALGGVRLVDDALSRRRVAAHQFSVTGAPVTSEYGLVVTHIGSRPSRHLMSCFTPAGTEPQYVLAKDPAHLEWLRELRGQIPLMTSVCTGALPLAAAGLLEGRRATTARAVSTYEVHRRLDRRPGDVFVDYGDPVTAAGLSAGMDMALHLVGRLAGPERSRPLVPRRHRVRARPAAPMAQHALENVPRHVDERAHLRITRGAAPDEGAARAAASR